MCIALVHNTTQNSSDNLPSYLQTNIIAQMLSIGGDGPVNKAKFQTQAEAEDTVRSSTFQRILQTPLFVFYC